MKTCANCVKPAVYNYMSTLYCTDHLPRFLMGRNGVSPLVNFVVRETPVETTWVAPTGVAVAAPVEDAPVEGSVVEAPVEEEEEPVRQVAPKPTPKKAKATPKDVAPSE